MIMRFDENEALCVPIYTQRRKKVVLDCPNLKTETTEINTKYKRQPKIRVRNWVKCLGFCLVLTAMAFVNLV